jgi:hypothetical protein
MNPSLFGVGFWRLFYFKRPFSFFWEVSMAWPVFILCVVDPSNAQGEEFDQFGLARRITNNAWTWFHE